MSRHLSFHREVEYMNSRSYVIFLTCTGTLSLCRSAGTEGGNSTCRAGQRARQRAKISKNRCAARREKSFLRAFSDFFKKLFRVQNLCFRLFSPVLRTTTRACVFIIFEKNSPKNFSKNLLTVVCTTAIIGTVNRTGAPPPDR